jgi:hypothetical protein
LFVRKLERKLPVQFKYDFCPFITVATADDDKDKDVADDIE